MLSSCNDVEQATLYVGVTDELHLEGVWFIMLYVTLSCSPIASLLRGSCGGRVDTDEGVYGAGGIFFFFEHLQR